MCQCGVFQIALRQTMYKCMSTAEYFLLNTAVNQRVSKTRCEIAGVSDVRNNTSMCDLV